jgi:hypothetical protein
MKPHISRYKLHDGSYCWKARIGFLIAIGESPQEAYQKIMDFLESN